MANADTNTEMTKMMDNNMSENIGHTNFGQLCLKSFKSNILLLCSIAGIVFGFTFGLAIRQVKPSDEIVMWIGKLL